MDLLTRDQFRKQALERDNNKCVICGSIDDIVVHHIVERRLWEDSGYYLNNAASLCPTCHIKAEQTVLSCEEIREKAGIKKIVLPSQYYEDDTIDKWGNFIMPNGMRTRGELFFDESVQKILNDGGILPWFSHYVKYPRTYHCIWSENISKTDRQWKETPWFENKRVIVSVKMDGESCSCYRDYMHARSLSGTNHISRNWMKNYHSQFAFNIPENWRICGENLWAKHSIHYQNLKNYFLLFQVWNDKNICLSWDETLEWAELLGIPTVSVIYDGIWDEDLIRKINLTSHEGDPVEGYVIRLADSFSYSEFKYSVAKCVYKKFAQELKKVDHMWRFKAITPNKMREL